MEKYLIKNRVYVKGNIELILMVPLMLLSFASPLVIHSLGLKGTEYLPIFFALTLSSVFLSFPKLVILAALIPTLNMLITKMPAVPVYYFILLESVCYAIFIALGRKLKINFFVVASLAFILARLSSIVLVPFFGNISVNSWFSSIVYGYKGIILNAVLPILLFVYFKIRNIER